MDPRKPRIDIADLDTKAASFLQRLGERYVADLEPSPALWEIWPSDDEARLLSHLRLRGLVRQIDAFKWALTVEGARTAVDLARGDSPANPRGGAVTQGFDVVVLTAIALEFQAVLKVEAGAWDPEPWRVAESAEGLPLATRVFRGKRGARLRVAATQAGDMGGVAAVNALLPLVVRHAPRCIAMCGVCAGRPGKTNLGDVIAAERLFFHDSGKQLPDHIQQDLRTYNLPDDWKVALEHFDFAGRLRNQPWWRERPIPYEWQQSWVLLKMSEGVADPSTLPECDHFCPHWGKVIEALWRAGEVNDGTLSLTAQGSSRARRLAILHRNRFPDLSADGEMLPFRVHVAPMGTGNRVIEDPAVWSFVSDHMRRALGIEMEAAALGALAHAQQSRGLRALVMKGVMDFANDGRDDHFKEFAARASAECLLAFLREHLDVGSESTLRSGAPKRPPP